jgi:hypothetical protein
MSSASLKFIENLIKRQENAENLNFIRQYLRASEIYVRNGAEIKIAFSSRHHRRIICVTMREIFLCSVTSSEAKCSSDGEN